MCNAPKYQGMFPSGVFDATSYPHEPPGSSNAAAATAPSWASRSLFKHDPPDACVAGFGVCVLSGLNPPQALKVLAKDFEPYWRMIVPVLLRVRAVELLPRFDLPQLLRHHSVNGTVQVRAPLLFCLFSPLLIFLTPLLQPWFKSDRGSPRTTFAGSSGGQHLQGSEEEEPLAPMLTPLLLDSSSNSYVDTWLQVAWGIGGEGDAAPPSALANATNENAALSMVART